MLRYRARAAPEVTSGRETLGCRDPDCALASAVLNRSYAKSWKSGQLDWRRDGERLVGSVGPVAASGAAPAHDAGIPSSISSTPPAINTMPIPITQVSGSA